MKEYYDMSEVDVMGNRQLLTCFTGLSNKGLTAVAADWQCSKHHIAHGHSDNRTLTMADNNELEYNARAKFETKPSFPH